ncbi:hypothetical protein [Pontivivens insulae]|uniref:Nucleotide-diphospho-sugar transferase domain-containing protein n=1 Tax=Pontivivens insulae TaxID=1639689 RepID=A0A2R8AA66_9RHOB|nr:hypothetical protein [Pontivivens insulae]RED13034.1 hypothetical protein DFR53_2169 [Pontivivens insulae]SPF29126.1 hypothetical protein POI8812_01432 [Pontivivens insulae]
MSRPIRLRMADRLAALRGPASGQLGIIYVIDRGKFEWQSVLLLASLRRAFGRALAIHAYIPASVEAEIDARVVDFHRANGVIPKVLDDAHPGFARPYPHGNKILACAAPRSEPFGLFVDTDILALKGANPITALGQGDFGAVPARDGPWRPDHRDMWDAAYAALDLPLASGPYPYFNAGTVLFRQAPCFGRSGDQMFGQAWLEIARALDHAEGLNARRPWLDQIALGVIAGLVAEDKRIALDRAWNHSLTGNGQRPDAQTVLLHYHGGAQGNRLRNVMGRSRIDALLEGDDIFGDFNRMLRALEASIAAHERPGYKRPPRQAKLKQDWE